MKTRKGVFEMGKHKFKHLYDKVGSPIGLLFLFHCLLRCCFSKVSCCCFLEKDSAAVFWSIAYVSLALDEDGPVSLSCFFGSFSYPRFTFSLLGLNWMYVAGLGSLCIGVELQF